MTLTSEQVTQLKDFFPVQAHEFLNGNTYLTEESITDRLDEVDPSWEFHKLELTRINNTVTAMYRLTVCGVSRDGVGMATVTYLKDKDKNPTTNEANEAEKSAATDALKRCARLFGIGRYILEMGRGVNDQRSLEVWLNQRRRVNPPPPSEPQPLEIVSEAVSSDLAIAAGQNMPATPPAPVKTPQQRLGTPQGQTIAQKPTNAPAPGWKSDARITSRVFKAIRPLYNAPEHMQNSIKAMEASGTLTDDMNEDLAIATIRNHKDKSQAPF
jgi:hypothetical protein